MYYRRLKIVALTLMLAIDLSAGSYAQTISTLSQQHEQTLKLLETTRSEIQETQGKTIQLKSELNTLEMDQKRLNEQLITLTSQSRDLENNMLTLGTQVNALEKNKLELEKNLNDKSGELSLVLASLQRLGRNPPPAILVRPEDALSAVRSSILLGALLPDMQTKLTNLRENLAELQKIGDVLIQKKSELKLAFTQLLEKEGDLNVLLNEKKRRFDSRRKSLTQMSIKTSELAARHSSLTSLLKELDNKIHKARASVAESQKSNQKRIEQETANLANVRQNENRDKSKVEEGPNLERMTPAISFSKARGLLPLPVVGIIQDRYGDLDDTGNKLDHINIATRSDAAVISPADGWVVFSGEFRSYGNMIILDVGENYHIILSGIDVIHVSKDQFVLRGEPIGKMAGNKIARSGPLTLGSKRPVLRVEFKKQQNSVDPTPWWLLRQNDNFVTDG